MDFLKAMEQFGVGAALLGVFFIPLAWYFVSRDQSREARLGKRLDAREEEVKMARQEHIGDLRNIVVNNTNAVHELTQTLRDRPCLQKPKG